MSARKQSWLELLAVTVMFALAMWLSAGVAQGAEVVGDPWTDPPSGIHGIGLSGTPGAELRVKQDEPPPLPPGNGEYFVCVFAWQLGTILPDSRWVSLNDAHQRAAAIRKNGWERMIPLEVGPGGEFLRFIKLFILPKDLAEVRIDFDVATDGCFPPLVVQGREGRW